MGIWAPEVPQGEWRWNDGVGHRMLWAVAAMREPRGPREFRQEKGSH